VGEGFKRKEERVASNIQVVSEHVFSCRQKEKGEGEC
jgi:hypothetical protein